MRTLGHLMIHIVRHAYISWWKENCWFACITCQSPSWTNYVPLCLLTSGW